MRRHTCTKYFEKSKIGSKRANNSCNHDRECKCMEWKMWKWMMLTPNMTSLSFWIFLDMASFSLYFWLVSLHVLTFFFGCASLARHLFSLPHCGSCFFGMPSFLCTSLWVMLLWHDIFPLFFFSIAISFCMNVWQRWITFRSINVVKMKYEWLVWKWTMNVCTWSRS